MNIKFHLFVRDACPNPVAVKLLENPGKQALRYRHLAMSLPGRLSVSLEEHRWIREALRQRDPGRPGSARTGTERASTALIDLLKQNPQLL